MIRPRMLVIAAAALIALSGCGGSSDAKAKSDLSDLSVSALLAKAKAQVAKEKDVSFKGSTTESGSTIELDLGYSGDDSTGTITIDDAKLTILKVGSDTYFKGDDAFWKLAADDQAASIIKTVNGKWVKASADSNVADLLEAADKSFIAKQMLVPDGTPTKGKAKTIDGVDCLALDDGSSGSLYVAADDARPIRLSSAKSKDGDVVFTYDAVDIPDAPAAADVIDESELG